MAKPLKLLLFSILLIALLTRVHNPVPVIGPSSAYGQQSYTYIFPLFVKQEAVYTSTSYYMTTLNSAHIYDLGCQLGTRDRNTIGDQNSVAVLAFGYPRCFSSGGYGANLFGYGPVTTTQVSNVIKQFALGYYTCTGSDHGSNLVIGAGTSNYQGGTEFCDTTTKATAHGTAWSGMVRDLNQWAVSQGIYHQVQIFGANDIEVGWNSPAWSRAWIAGFEQVDKNFMLHFGDAAGCPYEDKPTWNCGSSTYPEWTLEDVWYVSYGAPSALPLPLIYLTTGVHAKQWAYLSQYGVAQHGYRMDFTGVFTQWAACQQFSWCNTTDNTPEAAYQQLNFELSKSSATAQFIPWKTDIRWILQSEITSASAPQGEAMDEKAVHLLQQEANRMNDILDAHLMSPSLHTSLEEKRETYQTMADMAATSKNNPVPKDSLVFIAPLEIAEIAFSQGIIEKGEMVGLPYGFEIINVWQGLTDSGYLQIGAGASSEHSQQGALYVVQATPDRTSFQSTLIQAPEGCGPLAIYKEDEGILNIQSLDGCTLTFDLATRVLTSTAD